MDARDPATEPATPEPSGLPASIRPGDAGCGDPDCLECLERIQAVPALPPRERDHPTPECRDCRDTLFSSTSLSGHDLPEGARILVVSDRMNVAAEVLAPSVAPLRIPVQAVQAPEQLLQDFGEQRAAVVVLDLPREETFEIMAVLFRRFPDAVVLVMRREWSGQDPPEWQRAGAFACFDPAAPPESFREMIRRALGVSSVQTDRRRLRERLVLEKNTNRSTLRQLPMGILILDAQDRVISSNPVLERLTGLEARDFPDLRHLLRRVAPEQQARDLIMDVLQKVKRDLVPLRAPDVTFVRASDDSRRQMSIQVAPLPDEPDAGTSSVLIVQDVTTERRLTRQVVQNERLVAIGEMAASVAHELKNPLTGIAGALDLLLTELPPRSDLDRIRREIQAQLRRLNELSSDLLNFAKPVQVDTLDVRFGDLVRSITATLAHDPIFKDRKVEISGEDLPVPVDGVHFPLVLQNLLLNAAQASAPEHAIGIGAEQTQDGFRIFVDDHGGGIPDDLQQKVFVPFYTTKSKGTGLGLPICRKVVEAHGGTIGVGRSPSGGARMVINLPRVDD